MEVCMSEDEKKLFAATLRPVTSYVEFGCGGSTIFALSHMRGTVISQDSSREWLDSVAAVCTEKKLGAPQLVLADIGPTGEWGRPADESCRARWPSYSGGIWSHEGTEAADLYLVDGRFRIACFLETLLHCRSDSVILIHDFAPRPDYHIVRNFAREVASASTLSAFVRRPSFDKENLMGVLDRARYDPA
jgi:hypothetical protein